MVATNTFNANAISQADYGCAHGRGTSTSRRRSSPGLRRCRRRKDPRRRFVAGAIGPTNKTLSVSPNVNDPGFREVGFDEVKGNYREQVDGLIDGGVDFILIETVFDTLNAKAGGMAVDEARRGRAKVPVMVSIRSPTCRPQPLGPDGRGILAFGAPRQAADHRAELQLRRGPAAPLCDALAEVADTLVCVYPNAGLPNELGAI